MWKLRILLSMLMLGICVISGQVQAKNTSKNKNLLILLPVNVNTATADILDKAMDGVGPRKAAAIVEYRLHHGPFKSLRELTRVKGIGPGTLQRNAGRIDIK